MPTPNRCPSCDRALVAGRCPACGAEAKASPAPTDSWWIGTTHSEPLTPAAPTQAAETNWWAAEKMLPPALPTPLAAAPLTPPPLAAAPLSPPAPFESMMRSSPRSPARYNPSPRPLVVVGIFAGLILAAGLVIYLSIPSSRKSPSEADDRLVKKEKKEETPRGQEVPSAPKRDEKSVVGEQPIVETKPPVKPEPEMIVRNDPLPPIIDPPTIKEPEKVPVKPPVKEPEKEPVKPVELVKAPVPPGKLVVKRRKNTTSEDLRREIEKVPEVALDRTPDRVDSSMMLLAARQAHQLGRPVDAGPALLKQQRLDLAGLPLRMGDACKIGPAAADHLQGGSVTLRAHLFAAAGATASRSGLGSVSGDTRPDPQHLHNALKTADDRFNKWLKPEAIPALQQLLMAENESIREVLVDQLSRIEGPKATVALAQRALFDLNPDVRRSALEALRDRNVAEYQQILLDGFRHPWSVVADHAAESIVALHLTASVPKLLGQLDLPDPSVPYTNGPNGPALVRDMVRINHLRNCLMCHPPSFSSDDKVRGFVPRTDQPLPPAFTREYYAPKQEGVFVRADVTYLQQDFSTPLTVPNHGIWPAVQRYDFMVRERLALLIDSQKAREKAGAVADQHKAVMFALRELTGQDPGPSPEDWKRFYFRAGKPERLTADLQSGAGIAVMRTGQTFICDASANALLKLNAEAKPLVFVKDAAGWSGLALDGKGRLIACQTGTGRLVAVDAVSGKVVVLADGYKGQRFHIPSFLAVDRNGGVYLTDPGAGEKGAVYYVSAQGTVTRLVLDMVVPRGIALAADEKTLFLTSSGSNAIHAYPLESAGVPGPGRIVCKLDGEPGQGGNGMASDTRGHIYVCHPARRAVQVLNAEGAKLALLPLPEAPLHCCVGGEDGKRCSSRRRRGCTPSRWMVTARR